MIKYISLIALLLAVFTSCINEDLDDCPVPANINIVVEDKNYDNASDIEDYIPVDENLPMQEYVNPLSALKQKSGANDEASLLAMKPEEKMHTIPSEAFSDGNYNFIVAGNYTLGVAGENLIALHPEESEGVDIYLGHDAFTIPLSADRTIMLNRAKGKLLMLFTDFPESIDHVDVSASNIYSTINLSEQYSGNTIARKSFTPGQPDTDDYYGFMLAPTIQDGTSPVLLEMRGADGSLISTISNINLVITRNHLTVLHARYIPDEDKWEVSLFFDGEWKVVHNLTISS